MPLIYLPFHARSYDDIMIMMMVNIININDFSTWSKREYAYTALLILSVLKLKINPVMVKFGKDKICVVAQSIFQQNYLFVDIHVLTTHKILF